MMELTKKEAEELNRRLEQLEQALIVCETVGNFELIENVQKLMKRDLGVHIEKINHEWVWGHVFKMKEDEEEDDDKNEIY